MKNQRICISLFLILCIILTVFTACGGKGNPGNASSGAWSIPPPSAYSSEVIDYNKGSKPPIAVRPDGESGASGSTTVVALSMKGNASTGDIGDLNKEYHLSYTATKDGLHLVSCKTPGASYVTVYDAANEIVDSHENAVAVTLKKGASYKIVIENFTVLGKYTVTVTLPAVAQDITAKGAASGTIISKDQILEFYYTAPKDGTYQVSFAVPGGCYVDIYNSKNELLESAANLSVVNLKAGEKNLVQILDFKEVGNYSLKVIAPGLPIDITAAGGASGSNISKEQVIEFLYTAPEGGYYKISSSSPGSDVSVYDANGTYLDSNSNSVSIALKKGAQYKITLSDFDIVGHYVLTVTLPNIKLMTGGSYTGSAASTDDVTELSFVPTQTGEYTVTCTNGSNTKQYVTIFNPSDVEIDSGSKTFTTSVLTIGQTYRVVVEKVSGSFTVKMTYKP